MIIKKKVLFSALAVVTILSSIILSAVFIDFPFGLKTTTCSEPGKSCGIEIIGNDGRLTRVSGVITKKYIRNGQYYFDFLSTDKNKRAFITTLTLPPKEYKDFKITVNLTPYPGASSSAQLLKRYSPSEFYDILKIPQEVLITVIVLVQNDAQKIKKIVPNEHYISCFDFHKKYLEYINNPKIATRISLYVHEKINDCSLSIHSLTM